MWWAACHCNIKLLAELKAYLLLMSLNISPVILVMNLKQIPSETIFRFS